MRSLFALVLVSSIVACGGSSPAAGGDDVAPPDASGSGSGSSMGSAVNGFSVVTPDITITPGQEITYCYYFHTSNTSDVVVKNWQSTLAPGSHHLILYFQGSNAMPDGTLDPSGNCGAGGNSIQNLPIWTYSSSQPTQETDMPADDGTGTPVGMLVPAGQAAVMQLHYINTTDANIIAHASVNANGYAPGVKYTKAAAFVTYNQDINIPAGPSVTPVSFSASCTTPAGAKFFTMSTHSHKQTMMDVVDDGTANVFTTTDWEHPTVMNWAANPFFSFASGKLNVTCTYVNPTGNVITAGPSAATNEMCMAVGYYFPATQPQLCLTYGGQSYIINN